MFGIGLGLVLVMSLILAACAPEAAAPGAPTRISPKVPTPTTPAPEMMSGRFELTGGVKPEPVQAYVISDDVTNNQDKLAAIRRRATI